MSFFNFLEQNHKIKSFLFDQQFTQCKFFIRKLKQLKLQLLLLQLNSSQSNSEYYGLSPGGIGKSGYQGHSFWDTEMWMLPPITLLEPKWSEDLLYYRFLTRVAA